MANKQKSPKISMTTAYRQNNYLIVDNKPNSVTVSVYFRMSNKQIIKPNMKAKIRKIKNSVHKYDEGQRLVRELTSDVQTLPKKKQLTELVHYLLKYESLTDIKTFQILWKRLTDYQTLRHVEKSLLVIEHILKQKHPFYSKAFEQYCTDRKPEFIKLQNYHYKIDGSDIGQNVRTRATDIYKQLFKPQNIPPEYIDSCQVKEEIKAKKHNKKKKKKRKKSKHNIVKDVKDDIKEQDLLSLNINNFTNSNSNINNNIDIFDVFGELPPSQQNFNTTNNQNNTNTVDYNFPVTF